MNTVVLGEGMSKYQIPPRFGHHSLYYELVRIDVEGPIRPPIRGQWQNIRPRRPRAVCVELIIK